MSNVRSWKAIKNPVFEQTQNTLIISDGDESIHFSKPEDKYEELRKLWLNAEEREERLECFEFLFVWVWAKRSDVFKLDAEDVERLLDNK